MKMFKETPRLSAAYSVRVAALFPNHPSEYFGELVELIEQFNLERSAAQKPAIRIGIGVATGEVVAGYTGTQQRATYTCIGDTVNLAARLEAHTKVAGYGILIDEDTQRALKGVRSEALGAVPFKGKSAAVEIFAVGGGQV
jgi:class 3 adenylate cyclase